MQRAYGDAGTLWFEEIEDPVPGPRQVLVRVRAAGIDRGAQHLMQGLPYVMRIMGFGLRRPRSPVPGTNLAGTVEAVGLEVTGFRPGDEVYGTAAGAFAELAVADEDALAPKPGAVGMPEASVLPYAGTVALQAIRDRARLEPGQSVLMVGASGAVGTIAVQIAKADGAEVTGVCSASNAPLVRDLGADRVLDREDDDVTSGRLRHDVVLDLGGLTPLRRLRRAVARDGRLILIGGEGGGRLTGGVQRHLAAPLLAPLLRRHIASIIAKDSGAVLRTLGALVEGGQVRPVMDRTYPLSDAAFAVRQLDAPGRTGRIALVP